MDPQFDPGLFKPALIILAAAVVIPLFHRRRLSPVLGFMLVWRQCDRRTRPDCGGVACFPAGAGRLFV